MRHGPAFQTSGLVLIAMLLLCAGCASSSFHREWTHAAVPPAPADSLEGAWAGKWMSYSNGHTGELRATIRRAGDGYTVRFDAEYAGVFSSDYEIRLGGATHGSATRLRGAHDLGRLLFWELGEYRYRGAATASHLHAEYASRDDAGFWELHRPAR